MKGPIKGQPPPHKPHDLRLKDRQQGNQQRRDEASKRDAKQKRLREQEQEQKQKQKQKQQETAPQWYQCSRCKREHRFELLCQCPRCQRQRLWVYQREQQRRRQRQRQQPQQRQQQTNPDPTSQPSGQPPKRRRQPRPRKFHEVQVRDRQLEDKARKRREAKKEAARKALQEQLRKWRERQESDQERLRRWEENQLRIDDWVQEQSWLALPGEYQRLREEEEKRRREKEEQRQRKTEEQRRQEDEEQRHRETSNWLDEMRSWNPSELFRPSVRQARQALVEAGKRRIQTCHLLIDRLQAGMPPVP